MLEKVKEKVTENLITIIFTVVTFLIAGTVFELAPLILPILETEAAQKSLLKIIALLVVLLFIESGYILYLRHEQKSRFKTHYGIKWDSNLTPYCIACETALTGYGHYRNFGWGFKCIKCDRTLSLRDDSGRNIELSEAKDLIRLVKTEKHS